MAITPESLPKWGGWLDRLVRCSDSTYGRGCGVGRTLGIGIILGVGVAVGVGLEVGAGVGVAPVAPQYLPPVFVNRPLLSCPPQTIISLPVQMAV